MSLRTEIPKAIWLEASGFNLDGELIGRHHLMNHDGMVLAAIDRPQGGEITFQCEFMGGSVPGFPDLCHFIDFTADRKFCEKYATAVYQNNRPIKRRRKVKG